ncbi:hypothetical protein TNCV_2009631 [Trichonephila clavipes]|nr:hypothetical protein TNCV_2009631 [Trichonephila clavipes]
MLLASIGDESPMWLPCVETRVPGKEGPGVYCLCKHGLHEPGNPSDPSLFSALFLAIIISLFFFSTSGAHFRVSTGGHVPEVPE